MVYLGVDPGKEGVMAFLFDDGPSCSKRIVIEPIPVIKVGTKHEYRTDEICMKILPYIEFYCVAALEALHAMPSGICSGVTNFSLGRSSGLFEGIFAALKIPYQKIPPKRWQAALLDGLPKEKGSSVIAAKRLFPNLCFSLKKSHNQADAILLAEYLRRTYTPSSQLRSVEELRVLD